MDALLFFALGAAGIAGLAWLAARVSSYTKLSPGQEPGEGVGDREPRNPRPLVGIAADAKEEPWPERDDPDG